MQNLSRPLILVGGSVRAAAADARRAGYQVIAVDRFGDRDLRTSCKHWVQYDAGHQWIARLAELHSVPLVPVGGFSWPTAQELTPEIDDFLGSRLIAYPDQAEMDRLNSPHLLGKIAEGSGAIFPETRQFVEGKFETVFQPKEPQSSESSQWLVKPKNHAGGVGIHLASQETRLCLKRGLTLSGRGKNTAETTRPPKGQTPFQTAPRVESWQFLQRKINGRSLGANYLAMPSPNGPVVSFLGAYGGLTYRRNPEHRFLYGGSFGPLTLSNQVVETLKILGVRCAQSLTLVGLFNLDLICKPDQTLALLEVNPRFSGSMELIGQEHSDGKTSLSLIDWHLIAYKLRNREDEANHLAFPVHEQASTSEIYCKRIVYAQAETPHASLVDWEKLANSLATGTNGNVKFCDIPDGNAAIATGAPICTAVVSGAVNFRQAIQMSAQAARRVRRSAGQRLSHTLENVSTPKPN